MMLVRTVLTSVRAKGCSMVLTRHEMRIIFLRYKYRNEGRFLVWIPKGKEL